MTSSSTAYNGPPEKAVDGQWNNGWYQEQNGVCSHTGGRASWIRVDLGETYIIAALNIVGRTRNQGNPEFDSKNWTIRIGNSTIGDSGALCASGVDAGGGHLVPVTCGTKLSGRYVAISSSNHMDSRLHL